MKYMILAIMFAVSGMANAKTDYCHDETVNQEWKDLVSESPADPLIIKLAGLREGLCRMIDRGEINYDFGNDIWNMEHERAMHERNKDQLESKRDKSA